MEALKTVIDPELHQDLVSLGMVASVSIEGSRVQVTINLTTPACPLKGHIESDIHAALGRIGADQVTVEFGAQVRGPQKNPIPGVKNVIAIGSGKGGVGKSTIAVHLAIALAQEGAQVGLLDADIYGPSQAHMMGVEGQQIAVDENKRIIPLSRYGIRLLSIANIVPSGQAMIWRGPILHGTIRQFLEDVNWGELDYLLVDLPPGTGDVQLSLSQLTSVTGGVIVTTPQEVARIDAERAADMFRKVNVTVLGVIENMSYYMNGEEPLFLFGRGGGKKLAVDLKVTFLGEVPIELAIREGGDSGTPVMASAPEGAMAGRFRAMARILAGQISVKNLMSLPMV